MASTLALSSLVIQVLAAAATSVYHPPTTHKPQIHQSSILCLFHVSRLQTHLVPLPPTTKDNLESVSCCGARADLCGCRGCENICKCVARLSSRGSAWNPPCADTQGWEAVSTTQPLAAEEVTLIMSCQCLQIRVSTTISYPRLCLCRRPHPCACVYVGAR